MKPHAEVTLELVRLLGYGDGSRAGQALELSPLSDQLEVGEHYFDIIRRKPVDLFRTPARGALLLAGVDRPTIDKLLYFEQLGLIFQLSKTTFLTFTETRDAAGLVRTCGKVN